MALSFLPLYLLMWTEIFTVKYEITQAQWRQVANLPAINTFMDTDPAYFKGANLPVEQVSWEDAVEFCARLSKATGKEYRLPTEAEWEYAARAGSKSAYAGNLEDMGWYDKNSNKKTHFIGQKLPNAWGLYDMYGNVWEWCSDWYGDYLSGVLIDPKGASSGSGRIFRGGSWRNTGNSCRSAFRFFGPPNYANFVVGFRIVRVLP